MIINNKIGIIGGGSWATAIVKILSYNNSTINWYMRDKGTALLIKKLHRNPKYLSSVIIDPKRVNIYTDINEIVNSSDILILSIPSAFLQKALDKLTIGLENKIIFSAIKGIIPEKHLTIAEFLNGNYGVPINSIGIISGPCHAEEVALERLSYLTFSSKDTEKAKYMAGRFKCRFINCFVSDDIYGTEYSAVIKNIAAIAAGIFHGLGYGDNFLSVLISNAIQEIKRFIDTVHPNSRDMNSSAYLGDLLVTAYSQFSRNRSFGTMIGKGYSLDNAKLEMNMVAEGYYSTNSIHEVNKEYNVKMPICDAVYNVLYEGKSPSAEMKLLTKKLI
ncbi:NAD(P)H-dependent glycerol-3-phosphate dehydrogenase [Bacteroidota bacterium]